MPNDHKDADYDQRIIDRLGDLHERFEPVLATLVASEPRYGWYAAKLGQALEMAEELAPHNVAALALRPGMVRTEALAADAESSQMASPRFVGRCVAALAMDPDIMEKSGAVHHIGELVREYRFSELEEER